MVDEDFKINSTNSLNELSELRFDIEELDQDFGLNCRLRFGTMIYQHNDREYEVGVSRAFLRLNLEGCETTLDATFGESELKVVEELQTSETETDIGVSGYGGVDGSGGLDGSAAVYGKAGAKTKRTRAQSRTLLPVVAKPNDSWEVRPHTVVGKTNNSIEGTAIPSARLCVLRRKRGGNRMSVIAEVQVSKSAIKVAASHGNKMGKTLSEWRSKDVIVSQILKRAIQREAAMANATKSSAVVAISRCEIEEE
ncbi:hypothetical protein [Aestuariibius sp. HNIBRBA575]|uniref:hypothetical protein n=1 Tax=Aestuariibius sp. HNIBRBA575 TaxID=3233343 RepID=UPI0034A5A87B